MTSRRPRTTASLKAHQRIDAEWSDLPPFNQDRILVGVRPRLQPGKWEFRPQAQ
jgi:hypothetical protein